MYTAIKLGPKIDSDIHIRIMDKFKTIYQMAEDMTECDPSKLHEVTDELLGIYREDVHVDNHCENRDKLVFNDQCRIEPKTEKTDLANYFDESRQIQSSDQMKENLEYLLDKAETYVYSLVNGIKLISVKVRCPEQLTTLILKAKKDIMASIRFLENMAVNLKYKDTQFSHFSRIVNLESVTSKFSDMYLKIVEEHKKTQYPDIAFSSYFESPGEILNELTRIPLFIHMVSAIVCLL
eukprot:CAMPEP_0168340070 /NCGR_PEP_ID=MMETSP0213-20121227/13848_1 /TAXON_ID=151035 /ORGANISM="Euplotes harpa, Strain FSP1.4" /LENGTH=236 /DNA_ID=CAMNT_0008346243 /DNA_START=501 /DNA_END=1211 /DNA_ORIENTATION=-